MISTKPAAPTLTLIAWPITRIRNASAPLAKSPFPNIARIAAGTTSISSNTGTVPAIVQRVIVLNRVSRRAVSPRSCRSATNGAKT